MCGGFGLGGNRDHDEEALRRMNEHLRPGGTLVLDNGVPYEDAGQWPYWTKERRRELPGPWSEPGDRRTGSDGAEYELSGRLVDLDPLAQLVTMEMRGSIWRNGQLIQQDQHVLKMTTYFTNEVRLMLERAGFSSIEMHSDYTDEEPTGDSGTVVFAARKASPVD